MRRYTNLYGQVIAFENLYLAFQKAARGKRSRPDVAAFEFDLESNLDRLHRELAAQAYRPGGYTSFYIEDPKHRLVSAAPFADRVVHHALCSVIEPIFERTFIADSYANRLGKGTHKALDRCQAFARRFPYVLQCDVVQFFPAVDHALLRGILARKLADDGVMWLVDRILEGGAGVLEGEYRMVYFPGDGPAAASRPRGLPVGNLTSQFWANVYLNELDQFAKRELHVPAYLRYVDDFVLFADRKRPLWAWKEALAGYAARLRLTLHERSSTVYPVQNGIPFLGFTVYPSHRRLRRRNGVAFVRRCRLYRRMVRRGEMTSAQLTRRVRGWVAHARHGSTCHLRRSLLWDMPARVRRG